MARHKILLVDDNQELLRLLARLMEAEDFEAVPCARGRAALEALAKEKPAVAVVDVLLPDMMGYDVGAALKKAGVPFLFMTGIFKGGRAASEARISHGAAGYFEKPFEARKLVETVRGLLPQAPAVRPDPVVRAVPALAREEAEPPVESDEPVESFELTGRVEVREGSELSAVIRGVPLQAGPIAGARPAMAPPVLRPGPPREGELRDNLPELITAFWLAQQAGALTVERGKVRKVLYFERGRPVYTSSNLKADRFGPFLARVGKLTVQQVELCEAAAQTKGRRAGDVLVEMGLLKETEKLYFVGQQLKAIAYSLFAWEDGTYRVTLDDRAAQQPTKLDLHPAHLIWRGVKKLYRPERLARLLREDARLIPTQQPAYGLHEIQLEDWEARLLPHVNGQRSVRELAALSRRSLEEVRATLWALVALEMLEPAPR